MTGKKRSTGTARNKKEEERKRVEALLHELNLNFSFLCEGDGPPDLIYQIGARKVAVEETKYAESTARREDAVQADYIEAAFWRLAERDPRLRRINLIIQTKGRLPSRRDAPAFAREIFEWSKRLPEDVEANWRQTCSFDAKLRLLNKFIVCIDHRWDDGPYGEIRFDTACGWVGVTEEDLLRTIGDKLAHAKPDGVDEMWLMVFGFSGLHGVTDMMGWLNIDCLSQALHKRLSGSAFDACYLSDWHLTSWRRDQGWQRLDASANGNVRRDTP